MVVRKEPIRNVVVAGPNGTLGGPVIHALLASGFNVTALTRDVDKTSKAFPNIKIVQGDFTTPSTLAPSLHNPTTNAPYDALIILTNRDQVAAQLTLIDAATLAHIAHLVPSEFGIPLAGELRSYPCFDTKREMEDHFLAQAADGAFTYTAIHTGLFLDWGLERAGLPVNLKNGGQPTRIFDGGETRFSATVTETIGRAVAAALERFPDERVVNRFLCVHSAVVSQKQILGYAKEVAPGREFPTVDLDTKVLFDQGMELIRKGERGLPVMHMLMARVTFGIGAGEFKENDNAVLGVPEWSEEQVKQFIGGMTRKLGEEVKTTSIDNP